MMLAFLAAGVLVTALGAWLLVRRWPLQVEDILGYFGLLAPDESLAKGQGPETPSSRQRRRRRSGKTSGDPPAGPEDPGPI